MITFYKSDVDDKINVIVMSPTQEQCDKAAKRYFKANGIPGNPVSRQLFYTHSYYNNSDTHVISFK